MYIQLQPIETVVLKHEQEFRNETHSGDCLNGQVLESLLVTVLDAISSALTSTFTQSFYKKSDKRNFVCSVNLATLMCI